MTNSEHINGHSGQVPVEEQPLVRAAVDALAWHIDPVVLEPTGRAVVRVPNLGVVLILDAGPLGVMSSNEATYLISEPTFSLIPFGSGPRDVDAEEMAAHLNKMAGVS